MKNWLACLLFCFVFSYSVQAQIVDAAVCDILANPASFDGKTVRIKGTVIAGFDEFQIKGSGCNQSVDGIWLAYPEGAKAKSGPAAVLQLQLARNNPSQVATVNRTPVKLDKNKEFKEFDSLLSTPYRAGGMCLGCVRYAVTATLVGRLDGIKEAGLVRDGAGKVSAVNGFGNLNRYNSRMVVQSVADVAPQEIDYSKAAAASKDDSPRETVGGDPVAAAHQAARAFQAGSPAANQVESAAAAFGKEGEDNGVMVGFGAANEVARNDGAKGNHDSPDGLLFDCTFDMDRLKGDALSTAIAHVGTHIADIRGPQANAAAESVYGLEYRAWQTTVLSAIANRQKTLTLPGGYLVWNSTWPQADRDAAMDRAVSTYLTEWALVSKGTLVRRSADPG